MKLFERTRWKQEKVEFDPLANLKRWVDKGCYFTMTNINKVGINPSSPWNTPLGVYAFPLNTEFYTKLINHTLEWGENAPYIQLIRPKQGSRIITLNFDKATRDKLIDEMRDAAGWTKYYEEVDIDNIINDAIAQASPKTPAGQFWNVMRIMASQAGEKTIEMGRVSPAIIRWRSLAISMGIDGFYDPGFSVIHENEPTQAVFFKPEMLEHLDTINNPTYKHEPREQENIKTAADARNIKSLMKTLIKYGATSGPSTILNNTPYDVLAQMVLQSNFPKQYFKVFFNKIMTDTAADDNYKIKFIKRLSSAGYGVELRNAMNEYVKSGDKKVVGLIQKVIG
jgi:hypothetical protein